MTCRVHDFNAHEGGSFRISLRYDRTTGTGKTTAHTDTYHGHFVKLVPNEQIVESDEFETDDPALRGDMTITITLKDSAGGTDRSASSRSVTFCGTMAINEYGVSPGVNRTRASVCPCAITATEVTGFAVFMNGSTSPAMSRISSVRGRWRAPSTATIVPRSPRRAAIARIHKRLR